MVGLCSYAAVIHRRSLSARSTLSCCWSQMGESSPVTEVHAARRDSSRVQHCELVGCMVVFESEPLDQTRTMGSVCRIGVAADGVGCQSVPCRSSPGTS